MPAGQQLDQVGLKYAAPELYDGTYHANSDQYSLALIYAGLGEKDQAFALLEKSYRDHTVDMLTLYYDPLIDNLRSDPRFADLLRRVGLK